MILTNLVVEEDNSEKSLNNSVKGEEELENIIKFNQNSKL